MQIQPAIKRALLWTPAQMDNDTKRALRVSLLSTFFWGLIAHAYQFFSGNFSHDSLEGIFSGSLETAIKIQAGRIFVPLYRAVARGPLETPWTIGLLALLFIGLSVFLIVRMFNVKQRAAIFFIAGVMTVNTTVTAMAATYLFELDIDMLALLAAVAAAYCWSRSAEGKLLQRCAAGAVCILLSLSTYQSYISVSITLLVIWSAFRLMDGENVQKTVLQGIAGIAMLAAGGVLYALLAKLVLQISGIPASTGYNSLQQMQGIRLSNIGSLIYGAYKDFYDVFRVPKTGFLHYNLLAAIDAVLFLYAGYAFVRSLFSMRKRGARLLACVLFTLLPLSANICYVLSVGVVHDLMRYATCLFYVLVILLFLRRPLPQSEAATLRMRATAVVLFSLVAVFLWNGVQTANVAYLKKEVEARSTLSRMTRVVDDLAETDGYVPGVTPVVFSGMPDLAKDGFEGVSRIIGLKGNAAITYDCKKYNAYFRYYLNEPMHAIPLEAESGLDAMIAEMPAFPEEGYIRMVDGTLIVKMAPPSQP